MQTCTESYKKKNTTVYETATLQQFTAKAKNPHVNRECERVLKSPRHRSHQQPVPKQLRHLSL